MLLAPIVTLLVLLQSAAKDAKVPAETEYKGVEFTKPTNWVGGDRGDAYLLLPPDTSASHTLIITIQPAISLAGRLPLDIFKIFVGAAESEATDVNHPSEPKVSMADGVTVISQSSGLTEAQLGDQSRTYQMISNSDSCIFVTIAVNNAEFNTAHSAEVRAFLKSVRFVPPPPTEPKPAETKSGEIKVDANSPGHIGYQGWLPSGQGTAIPPTAIKNGKPLGLFYNYESGFNFGSLNETTVFLEDGTLVEFPEFGAGKKVDLDRQRRSDRSKSIGTWTLSDKTMTMTVGGFVTADPFEVLDAGNAPSFKIGKTEYHAAIPLEGKDLVGSWYVPDKAFYMFGKDGTVLVGKPKVGDDNSVSLAVGATKAGKWVIDGYLLAIDLGDSNYFVNVTYKVGADTLGFGSQQLLRVK